MKTFKTWRFGSFKETKLMYNRCKELLSSFKDISFWRFYWKTIILNQWEVILIPGKQLLPYGLLILKSISGHQLLIEHYFLVSRSKSVIGEDNPERIVSDFFEKYFAKRSTEGYRFIMVYTTNVYNKNYFKDILKFEEEKLYKFNKLLRSCTDDNTSLLFKKLQYDETI